MNIFGENFYFPNEAAKKIYMADSLRAEKCDMWTVWKRQFTYKKRFFFRTRMFMCVKRIIFDFIEAYRCWLAFLSSMCRTFYELIFFHSRFLPRYSGIGFLGAIPCVFFLHAEQICAMIQCKQLSMQVNAWHIFRLYEFKTHSIHAINKNEHFVEMRLPNERPNPLFNSIK